MSNPVPDERALARLGELLLAVDYCCTDPECRAAAVRRLIATPGVEVSEELLITAGPNWGHLSVDSMGPDVTHRQVVIRLPMEEVEHRD